MVLDTNVLISATIADKGFPATIVRAFERRELSLITSLYILAEYAKVMQHPHISKKYKPRIEKAEALVRYLNAHAIIASPQAIERVIPNDAKDDAILACAKAGKAQYIVSGDEHLLKLRVYRGIKILTPREFVESVLHQTISK